MNFEDDEEKDDSKSSGSSSSSSDSDDGDFECEFACIVSLAVVGSSVGILIIGIIVFKMFCSKKN